MARKKPHEEHENHERYLVTYADLITLLLAFFIILYAMSVVDQKKFDDVAHSLSTAFLPQSSSSLANIPLNSENARTPTSSKDIDTMKAVKEQNDLRKIKEK